MSVPAPGPAAFPARPSEQLLLDLLPDLNLPAAGIRGLCNTAGRGQFAATLAAAHPTAQVTCLVLDLYQQRQATAAAGERPNLQFACQTDFPSQEAELVALAFTKQGDAELTRDLLQQGHERLLLGGRLIATTDNPTDVWLHERLRDLFPSVTRRPAATGVAYLATKKAPLRKLKDYACEFAFRDGQSIVHLRTRPGVFSHRSLDGGARSLIQSMTIRPGSRVLDLGCGSGAVGLAAALRDSTARVTAIDSNPRAIESAQWGATRNGLTNLTAALDCDGSSLEPGAFDLALANPPYYSNFRLAELFISIAQQALKPGGTLQVVTKTPDWYFEHLPPQFLDVAATATKSYVVVTAHKR